jgi:hypothetical protein
MAWSCAFVSPFLKEDEVDFVVLKRYWRWKHVADVEDAAAEAEVPKCRCRWSRAGQRTNCSRGQTDRPMTRTKFGGRPTSRDQRRTHWRWKSCSLEDISEPCKDEDEPKPKHTRKKIGGEQGRKDERRSYDVACGY